ncbi:MAG: GAF domain-containing protein, partial [Coleofasciculus sp. Co-bin14]|nr:GAF domain-containing protein [Coleofasciculus sp. Co-bin14]
MSTRKPSSDLEKNQRAKGLTSRSLKAQSQKTKSIVSLEPNHHKSDELVNLDEHTLLTTVQLPGFQDIEQKKVHDELEWLIQFQRHSQLLMAVVEPGTFTLRYANDYFCSMMGIAGTYSEIADREIRLSDLLPDLKSAPVDSLYRQHVLHLVLRDIYKITIPRLRLLDQPVIISLRSPLYPEPRLIEFAFRSDQLTIGRLDSQVDELADLDLEQVLEEDSSARLIDSAQLDAWRQRLRLENYQLSG